MIKRGKHASNRVVFFGTSKRGKHAKDEIIVYNPLYAKITTCLGSFALATSLFTIATLGKYKGTLASSDTARVARYLIELTKKEETIRNHHGYLGRQKGYPLSAAGGTGSGICRHGRTEIPRGPGFPVALPRRSEL